MIKIICLLIGVLVGGSFAKDWWENGNFYQIYPRSFKDSDGDGIGDLNGVAEKLQYLKDIGVTGAWLSPIFKSPMIDFGYDISDYYQIAPEYGTVKDFEDLLIQAKKYGIKIILDFVPNHTSDEHEWFQKSVQRIEPYTDFYIWHDGIPNENGGRPDPPNNWVCSFWYSSWEWNEERQQYYYHAFGIQQPDLNYRSPGVVKAMKDVIRYWLDRGVDGFRVDAVPYLFENLTYADEPVDTTCPNPDEYCHTFHIYTKDQPESFEMIYQWRDLLDEYKTEYGGDTRLMLTEAYTSLENIVRFYGDGYRNGSYVPFNFELITTVNNNSSATDFANSIDKYINEVPSHAQPNWVLGNHDNKRIAARFGKERADLINILLQTLPGIAVTFNGEEIGMGDVFIPWDQTVDPQACNTNPKVFDSYSRDPARTPFHWDDSKNAGFSPNEKTWLPVSPDYLTNNVKAQNQAPISHLKVFKELVAVRQEPSFQKGTYERNVVGNDVLIYKRELSGSDKYVVVLNFGNVEQVINLRTYYPYISDTLSVVTTSIQSKLIKGDIVPASSFVAEPNVGTVLISQDETFAV